MMKIRFGYKIQFFFTLALLLVSGSSFAQSDIPQNTLSINFIAFFGPSHPNLELSYEHRFNDRFSLEVGINPIIFAGGANRERPGVFDKKGLMVRLEPKLSVNNRVDQDTFIQTFISFEIYHAWCTYEGSRFKKDDLGGQVYTYKLESKTLGLVPHLGYRRFSDHFVMEFSGGYGRRFFKIVNDFDSDFTRLSDYYRTSYSPEETGSHNWYLISANAKVGVTF